MSINYAHMYEQGNPERTGQALTSCTKGSPWDCDMGNAFGRATNLKPNEEDMDGYGDGARR
jgi:hypothetical protein